MEDSSSSNLLRNQANWEALHFYQKSQVLYQLTFEFTKRFLHRGDRTIDQMVQPLEIYLYGHPRIPGLSECSNTAESTINSEIINLSSRDGAMKKWPILLYHSAISLIK